MGGPDHGARGLDPRQRGLADYDCQCPGWWDRLESGKGGGDSIRRLCPGGFIIVFGVRNAPIVVCAGADDTLRNRSIWLQTYSSLSLSLSSVADRQTVADYSLAEKTIENRYSSDM